MKVLQINTFYIFGSTGRIAYDLMQVQKKNGIQSYIAYGTNTGANIKSKSDDNAFLMQGWIRRKINILRTRLFDNHGFYNETETKRLLNWIDTIKPDVIHLHNIHNHYIHVGMLFNYIKRRQIPIIWTLHDCWSFTGHCSHFDYEGCDKWKSFCRECSLLKEYPPTWLWDFSTRNYFEKKATFLGVENMILVTPSKWLADLTRFSFLSGYPVKIINNGVDTNLFKPVPNDNFKERIGAKGKKIMLAMASGFSQRKGGVILKELPKLLKDNEILLLVGGGAKKLAAKYPNHCIGVDYTNSINELVSFYSAADVFINPTLEDNFPTTNIEAMACGTPVVTFNTGGSVESVLDNERMNKNGDVMETSVGMVVPKGNLSALLFGIRKILDNGKESYVSVCRNKALERYDKAKQYQMYINLYKEIDK